MKGVKDIIKLFASQVTSNGLSTIAAASDLKDVKIEDDDYAEIKTAVTGLLTVESAVNNSDVEKEILDAKTPEIKAKILHAYEKRLINLAKVTGIDLGGAEKAWDMLDIFDKEIESKLGSNANEDATKLIESLKGDKDQLNQDILKQKSDHENNIQEQEEKFIQNDIKNKFELQAKSYEWDSHLDDNARTAITAQNWGKVNNKAKLKILEGDIVPMNKDNPDKELYIGNKKQTFQDINDPLFEPYLKKSDPNPPQGGSGQPTSKSEPTPAEKYAQKMAQTFG